MVRLHLSSPPHTELKRDELPPHKTVIETFEYSTESKRDELPPHKRVIETFAKGAEVPLTREQLTKMFKKQDKDNNGKLSFDELKAAFVELKTKWPWFRTQQAFRHADNNEDGYINIHDDQELERLVDYALKCGFTTN